MKQNIISNIVLAYYVTSFYLIAVKAENRKK